MASQSTDLFLSERISLKDQHLNSILDKLGVGDLLTESEGIFLEKFDFFIENDMTDFSHLSKNQVFDKICYLLDKNKSVICNLYDKDGIINDKIIKIENFFEKDCCVLTLKHGEVAKLFDKFLYKLSYNIKKNEYYLESQDEYFEKIIHNNEN